MKARFRYGVLFTLAVLAVPGQAQEGWQTWRPLEPGISLRFSLANQQTCTWAFRNDDSSRTLASMRFEFSYTSLKQAGAYNPYDKKTDKDILPYALKPGASVGGWTAYTAPADCNSVTIAVTSREWK